MAETDVPKWDFGLTPKINAVDASFVKYFPTCDSTKSPSAILDANATSWAAGLAVPTPHTRLPAWSRVAIQPHSSTHLTGLIMKRVGLTTPRTVVNAHTIAQSEPAKTVSEPEVDEEERRRRRRRVQKYEPTLGEVKYAGKPSTRAEAAALLMQAKVDASNNFMITSSETSFEDKLKSRTGTLVRVCPAKRYFGTDIPTRNEPVGGNKFPIYRDVMPIIVRAMRKGMEEVDYATASIAEASSIMRKIRRSRNPRQRLAVHGAPDLSDINDETEPESSYMIKPPTLKAESRSPQKRIAKLTSPVKNGFRRLSNIIKLIPGSSPKAEPSPSKSASTPSTPLRFSPTPTKTAATPTVNSSPLTRVAADASGYATIEDSPERPGHTFAVPDYTTDFSSMNASRSVITAPEHFTADNTAVESSPAPVDESSTSVVGFDNQNRPQVSSPVKYSRPVAPTPSRWNRPEPSTPQILTPVPAYHTDSPIGLASFIPLTPAVAKCPYQSETNTTTEFRFGDMSPSFNSSISWMNNSVQASEPRRIRNVNSARRRQSEPLIHKYLKTQARRRLSSPCKVTFQDEDSLFENISIASLFTLASPNAAKAVEPAKTNVPNPNLTKADAIPPQEREEIVSSTAPMENKQTTYAPTVEDGVLNIDMRQNQDIFHASVSQLAEMAQDRCSDQATVVVTEERGRLFVRFKLSAEHAWMFPQSQGFDESRFASSPLVSHSPRIRFNAQRSTFTQAQTTPGTATSKRYRFAGSPAMSQFSAQTPLVKEPGSDLGSLLDTPSMSVQYATPTMIMAEDATPRPTIKRTPMSRTPREPASDLGSLLDTPSMSVQYATPTMLMAEDVTPMQRSINRTPTDQSPGEPTSDLGSLLDTPSMSVNYATPTMVMAQDATPVAHRSTMQHSLISHGRANQSSPVVQTPELPQTGDIDRPLFDTLHSPTRSLSSPKPTVIQQNERQTPSKPADETIAVISETQTPLQSADGAIPTIDQKQTLIQSADDTAPAVAQNQMPITSEDETLPVVTDKHTPCKPVDEPIPTVALKQTSDNSLSLVHDTQSDDVPVNTTPVVEPTPTTSFTPVNKTSPRSQITTLSETQTTHKPTPAKTATAAEGEVPSVVIQQEVYDDSPGRDYMRDFIKRSRRTSTTETGSPIAPLSKRQPLGAKNPNTPSPQKKRKLQKDGVESPAKKQKKEESKAPVRKTRRAKSSRQQSELAINMSDDPASVTDAAVPETVNADEPGGEEQDAPMARRSSRLRSTRTSSAPKSSIPTAIKLGRSGAGRGTVLNSTVRSDQQELTAQTRANTKKNKGNAEYPAQVLVRVAEAAREDSEVSDSNGSNSSAGRKSVVWKEPLEEAQEEKSRKGRAATKTKATQGKSGITKPKTRTSTSKSKQTAKVAESLGMVANGTPARPQRMTRSQTRSRS